MILRIAAALVCAAALTGCAALGPAELPPAPVAVPPAAVSGAPAASTSSAPPVASGVTPPSPEALAVLASIPEPVPAQGTSGRGEPPARPAPRAVATAPASGASTQVSASAPATAPASGASTPATAPQVALALARPAAGDSAIAAPDTASVPVPAPTTPLGAESHPMPATPEPPVVAPPPVPIAPIAPVAPVVHPPAMPTAAGPDTCWRVQVGAPSERARGRMLRDASQSLLLAPMTLMHDAGRWKVRTRDCLSRVAAEGLRDRAANSGFRGVFLVRFVEHR